MFVQVTTILIITCALFLSFRSAATFRKNVVLNVTLPPKAQGDPRVQKIISDYKKSNVLLSLVSLGGGTVILLAREVSILLLLFTVWVGLSLIGGVLLSNVYSKKLMRLKGEEGWWAGPRDVVKVDLIVSREKSKLPLSRLWFIPALLIVLGLLGWGQPAFAFLGLGEVILFYLLYRLSAREPARAYSEDSRINLALTKVSIRGWTLCWVALANGHACFLLFLALFFRYAQGSVLGLASFLTTLATLFAIVLTGSGIQRKQNRLLQTSGSNFVVDEDHYWRGLLYSNPHDSRIMVPKRFGFGMTMNLGNKKGRAVFYGTVIGVGVLLLGLFFVFLALDTSDYALRIAETEIVVQAPLYGFAFATEDIKSVSLVQNLPRGTRTNGAETSRYAIGNYTVGGYGPSKLYVYKNSPPYIYIELDDLHIFFGAKTAQQTRDYYGKLQEMVR